MLVSRFDSPGNQFCSDIKYPSSTKHYAQPLYALFPVTDVLEVNATSISTLFRKMGTQQNGPAHRAS